MASESLYRKWRSQTFSDMVGQEPVIRTLKNALRSGKLAHAYLFTGPRGTGKTSTARLLAKTINCQNPQDGEPCNVCEQCREITNGSSFNVTEIDAASNRGIDSIRELREKIMVPPTTGKYKVYILDEAHMLTTEAFNALLKTLEEPPPHAIFVLATTDVHKMLPTVLSRCQRFEFKRFTLRQLVGRLQYVAQQEDIELQPGSAELIARAASGGMRDALSLLDQAMAYAGNVISLSQVQTMLGVADPRAIQKFIAQVAELDSPAGLHLINDLSEAGADLRQLNTQIAEYWRAMMLSKAGANISEILENTDEEIKEIAERAQSFTLPELMECARVFAQNELLQKSQATPQLGLELALLNCIEIHRRVQAGVDVTAPRGIGSQSAGSGPLTANVLSTASAAAALPQVPATPRLAPPSDHGAAYPENSTSPMAGPSLPQQAEPGTTQETTNHFAIPHNEGTGTRYGAVPVINLNGNAPPPQPQPETTGVSAFEHPDSSEVPESNVSVISIEDVNEKWELILRRVRTRKDGAKIAALLSGYTIVGIEGSNEQPIVVCQARADFHYKTLQNDDYQKTIVWALNVELSVNCDIRLLPPNAHYTPHNTGIHTADHPPAQQPEHRVDTGFVSEGRQPYGGNNRPVNDSAEPDSRRYPTDSASSRRNEYAHNGYSAAPISNAAPAPAASPAQPVSAARSGRSAINERPVPSRTPVAASVTEKYSPPALVDRAPAATVAAPPVETKQRENVPQEPPLARKTPVRENTTYSNGSNGETKRGRRSSTASTHETRREVLEKEVRNNPVIMEALRLFKADIKEIRPK